MNVTVAPLLATTILVLIHFLSPKMRFLDGIPRSRWLSVAGGVSVAYIFIHVMPELASTGEKLDQLSEGGGAVAEHAAYLVALLGLVVFYGLDKLALASRGRHCSRGKEDQTSAGVFWLHIASFGLYNLIIGYLLLHREENSLMSLALFAAAMALHFLVTDHGLYEHHKSLYRTRGRFVLAGAVALGWVTGLATTLPSSVIDGLFALLAGGVILNVLKEELPKERESRYWAFALGTVSYAAILLTA